MSPPRHSPQPDPVDSVPVLVSMLSATVRQFGVGMLFAAVFAGAVARMYQDLERKNDLLVSLVREQTTAAREVAENLRRLIELTERN